MRFEADDRWTRALLAAAIESGGKLTVQFFKKLSEVRDVQETIDKLKSVTALYAAQISRQQNKELDQLLAIKQLPAVYAARYVPLALCTCKRLCIDVMCLCCVAV